MILGSHNTMTYLQPKRWWLYPFKFMAKCLKLDFKEQYNAGARFFDFRLTFKFNGKRLGIPMFSHGLIDYTDKHVQIYDVLDWLDKQNDTVYVRLILEKGDEYCLEEFIRHCAIMESRYHNIQFVDARTKTPWQTVYNFSGKLPYPMLDKYASCNQTGVTKWKGILRSKNWSGLLIDDLWPWIYAKRNNKNLLNTYKDTNNVLILDFIKPDYNEYGET